MSDLSQLYINQSNQVDLWVRDLTASSNVQSASVGMPTRLQNYNEYGLAGATDTPCPVLTGGVIDYNSSTPAISNLQEYAFAGAYCHCEFSNLPQSVISAIPAVIDWTEIPPTGKNFGVFNGQDTFTISLTGIYQVNYSLSVQTIGTLPSGTSINAYVKDVRGAVQNQLADVKVITPNTPTGLCISGNCIAKFDKGDQIGLVLVSTFNQGGINVIAGNFSFNLISPY